MKKFFVMMALVLPMMASAQKYGHINVQEVFMLMPELKQVQSQVDTLSNQWENMLMNMQNEIKDKAARYDAEAAKGTLTDTQRQIFEEELQGLYQRWQTTQQTAQQDLQQKQQELMAPVHEKLLNAIQAVGKEKGYTYVFDTQAMLYVAPEANDVTADVKTKLGIK